MRRCCCHLTSAADSGVQALPPTESGEGLHGGRTRKPRATDSVGDVHAPTALAAAAGVRPIPFCDALNPPAHDRQCRGPCLRGFCARGPFALGSIEHGSDAAAHLRLSSITSQGRPVARRLDHYDTPCSPLAVRLIIRVSRRLTGLRRNPGPIGQSLVILSWLCVHTGQALQVVRWCCCHQACAGAVLRSTVCCSE